MSEKFVPSRFDNTYAYLSQASFTISITDDIKELQLSIKFEILYHVLF